MKDGDDIIMIGCTHGQVTAVDNVTFAPGSAINWNVTVTATGNDGFKLIMGSE
jgi:preprotein translocase subunit YajC